MDVVRRIKKRCSYKTLYNIPEEYNEQNSNSECKKREQNSNSECKKRKQNSNSERQKWEKNSNSECQKRKAKEAGIKKDNDFGGSGGGCGGGGNGGGGNGGGGNGGGGMTLSSMAIIKTGCGTLRRGGACEEQIHSEVERLKEKIFIETLQEIL